MKIGIFKHVLKLIFILKYWNYRLHFSEDIILRIWRYFPSMLVSIQFRRCSFRIWGPRFKRVGKLSIEFQIQELAGSRLPGIRPVETDHLNECTKLCEIAPPWTFFSSFYGLITKGHESDVLTQNATWTIILEILIVFRPYSDCNIIVKFFYLKQV